MYYVHHPNLPQDTGALLSQYRTELKQRGQSKDPLGVAESLQGVALVLLQQRGSMQGLDTLPDAERLCSRCVSHCLCVHTQARWVISS